MWGFSFSRSAGGNIQTVCLALLCEAVVRKEVLGKSFKGGKSAMLIESLGETLVMNASLQS